MLCPSANSSMIILSLLDQTLNLLLDLSCALLWTLDLVGTLLKSVELAAAAKSFQLCLTLFNAMDSSLPGSCPWNSSGKNIGVGCYFFIWTRTLVNAKNIYRKSRLTVYKQKIHRNQIDNIWHFLGYLWGWAFQMLVVHLVSSSVAFSIFTLFWWKWPCLTAMQETPVLSLGHKDPLEKG